MFAQQTTQAHIRLLFRAVVCTGGHSVSIYSHIALIFFSDFRRTAIIDYGVSIFGIITVDPNVLEIVSNPAILDIIPRYSAPVWGNSTSRCEQGKLNNPRYLDTQKPGINLAKISIFVNFSLD